MTRDSTYLLEARQPNVRPMCPRASQLRPAGQPGSRCGSDRRPRGSCGRLPSSPRVLRCLVHHVADGGAPEVMPKSARHPSPPTCRRLDEEERDDPVQLLLQASDAVELGRGLRLQLQRQVDQPPVVVLVVPGSSLSVPSFKSMCPGITPPTAAQPATRPTEPLPTALASWPVPGAQRAGGLCSREPERCLTGPIVATCWTVRTSRPTRRRWRI